MYKEKSIAIIIPVFNEEKNISSVINSIPDFIDEIIIVDDCSRDNTKQILNKLKGRINRLTIIDRMENGGSGAAKRDGYIYAKDTEHQIFITMDGDGQMDPNEINSLIDPIIDSVTDFTKANRLIYGDVYDIMPRYRFWGNAILTLFTKIASGYWHVTDAQTGYTACSKKVLNTLPFDQLYTDYGYPNHILVMLNIWNFRVRDIPSKPIYGVGEKSNIRVRRVVFKISWLLFKSFLWRLKEKYIIRDFHPLVFFYLLGFIFAVSTVGLSIRLIYVWLILKYDIPAINALAAMFSFMSTSLFTLFGMWFDMEINKELK